MKKILCTLAVVGLAASAFAQGQVNLSSGSNLVKDMNGASVAVNGGFVQLLWGTGPLVNAWDSTKYSSLAAWLTANPTWVADNEVKSINGPLAGRFGNQVVTIDSLVSVNMAVAAWLGNYASFDAAIAGASQGNISGSFALKPGNPNATPVPELPASTSGLFPGMTMVQLQAVPEPSSLALAGLGAAALLIFRRRK